MSHWQIKFDQLEFEKCIGRGNFGEVHKGSYLGTDVAIKKLFFVDDEFMQKYIEREMATLTGLSHPNIVQLMGLCIDTDDMYIVTEFISGGNLRSKLKDQSIPMDWKLRIRVLLDVALALLYLHSKGLMHRDLKSYNLLVDRDWKVKVCDFGLARSAPDESKNNLMTIVGTNEWMAPEIALGENYGQSADVFSFGMVIYELITRRKPPVRKIKDCYAFQPAEHRKGIPEDTPPALWDLLVKCAALEPKDRPGIKEVVADLKKILTEVEEREEAGGGGGAASEKKREGEEEEEGKKEEKKEEKKAEEKEGRKEKGDKKKAEGEKKEEKAEGGKEKEKEKAEGGGGAGKKSTKQKKEEDSKNNTLSKKKGDKKAVTAAKTEAASNGTSKDKNHKKEEEAASAPKEDDKAGKKADKKTHTKKAATKKADSNPSSPRDDKKKPKGRRFSLFGGLKKKEK
ncbi:Eukaryotic translation initiation factor 2 alpha kinase 3 [Balamuthia mandrillaris]